MTKPTMTISRRTRRTPYSDIVESLGVQGYTVYNRMLLATGFRGPEEDYWHLRQHVQLWDVSCERQIELRGPDAARLAQLMTPRNLSKATVGRCYYAPITDRNGGMLNDPVILKLADDRFWLSIADSDLLLWAKGLALGMGLDVEVFEADVYPLAVQGPKAEDLMADVFGEEVRAIRFFRFETLDFEGHPLNVARSGWSKQDGFEIYLDRPELAANLWQTLWQAGQPLNVGPGCPNLIERIEGALFSYGNDFTTAHNPLECGLEKYCDLDGDIDFIGRDALRHARDRGIARKLRGVTFGERPCPPCIQPWPVADGDRQVGTVTSAAWSPALQTNVAFAMTDRTHWETGTPITVQAPDGPQQGHVCDIPFEVPRL